MTPKKGPMEAGAAQLRLRAVPIDTLRENVVLLSRNCTALRPERLKGFRKVEVRVDGCTLIASILIADNPSLVGDDEIGVTEPALRRLNAGSGAKALVSVAPAARSLDAVQAKIRGETLSAHDMTQVVRDLAGHRLSDIEISAFLVACANFMTADEVLSLTRAMADAGAKQRWPSPIVVDKHSIGGIPGNRTTMIVAPIAAAHGLTMPKTSSRAITSPSGTADTMEVLARVALTASEMARVVESCHACIVWGGQMNLSPADDVLISVERPLSLDTPEQMVASILSKKLAAGATHVVLDMPVGPTAKIRSAAYAQRVRKLFEFVASRCGLFIDVIITDGAQPIGRGVGPVFEARDVMAVLRNAPDAPADLRAKAVELAGRVLEFDPALAGGAGAARADALLRSGAALAAMETIIAAQGPPPLTAKEGSLVHEVRAARAGHVAAIDCFRIARIARLAGAPSDPGAGLDLLRRVGDPVRKGDPLYRIVGEDRHDFAAALEAAAAADGFAVIE